MKRRPAVSRSDYEAVLDGTNMRKPTDPPPADDHVADEWYEVEDTEHLHVLPVYVGERKHDASPRCWCSPRPLDDEPRIWRHFRRAEA